MLISWLNIYASIGVAWTPYPRLTALWCRPQPTLSAQGWASYSGRPWTRPEAVEQTLADGSAGEVKGKRLWFILFSSYVLCYSVKSLCLPPMVRNQRQCLTQSTTWFLPPHRNNYQLATAENIANIPRLSFRKWPPVVGEKVFFVTRKCNREWLMDLTIQKMTWGKQNEGDSWVGKDHNRNTSRGTQWSIRVKAV